MGIRDYAKFTGSPHRFIVPPGHAGEANEVVESHGGYEIVEIREQYRRQLPES